MKQITLLILLVLITACGSSKKTIEKTEEQKPSESETEITETIEVKNETGETIGETDTIESAKAMAKENQEREVERAKSLEEVKSVFSHSTFNLLLKNNVSSDGSVDYGDFKSSKKQLNEYINSLKNNKPKDLWSKEDKLAYWINAYNALTIDLILRNYPLKSIKDIDKPWDQRLWKFGNKWLNLNDIEHQILRKMNEPRIHFAIVCASFSCPKLQNKAFTATNLEAQLTEATKQFLADETRNNISENNLKLSKIFKWFAKDFKTDGSLIDFLNKYTEVEISSKAKKSFKDYNWDLND